MFTPLARAGAALVLVLSASLASACSSTPPPAESTSSAAATPSGAPDAGAAAEPSAEPSATAVVAEDPSCDTIISDAIVDDFTSVGWTVRADPFYVGEQEVPEGLKCVWADFEGPAGDNVQTFGWAPIDDELAKDAQQDLVSQGWIRETGPEGVYITENPETTIAVDDEGYGMTYLFGDGWVMLADTKQGLVLIEWPRGD